MDCYLECVPIGRIAWHQVEQKSVGFRNITLSITVSFGVLGSNETLVDPRLSKPVSENGVDKFCPQKRLRFLASVRVWQLKETRKLVWIRTNSVTRDNMTK